MLEGRLQILRGIFERTGSLLGNSLFDIGLSLESMAICHFIKCIPLAWSLKSPVFKLEEKQGFYSVAGLVCRVFVAGVSWNT